VHLLNDCRLLFRRPAPLRLLAIELAAARAAALGRLGVRCVGAKPDPGNRVRTRLSAGGKGIRTAGPTYDGGVGVTSFVSATQAWRCRLLAENGAPPSLDR
jgi:hypothetical protein